MSRAGRCACVALLAALVATTAACRGSKDAPRSGTPTSAPTPNRSKVPLPPRVQVRATPQGVKLADPAFTATPGARADFGRLGGAVYQIEMPQHWNGRLVLYMHGFEDLGPVAHVTPPDFRRYLVGHGYAWGASSFSSTGLIPGRSADETAALWDYFVRKYGRPGWTYVSGLSMGGMSTHVAAERYANRFDGALALCGSAGQTPAMLDSTKWFVAGAFAAGVTQAQFDASTNVIALIRDRIVPALSDPNVHRRYQDVVIALTGGPRAFDRRGIDIEQETDWRRLELAVGARIAPNPETPFRIAGVPGVTGAEFDRRVIRLPVDPAGLHRFVDGNETTGRIQMPLVSLHTTGDGEVPISQAQVLQRRVDAAGKRDLLVQRVMRDPGHCGFTTAEQSASFAALVRWVEHGVKPLGTNVLVPDLNNLDRTFELSARQGLAGEGLHDLATVRGAATIDRKPFDATYLGAVVIRGGLVTPCQATLPPVTRGRFEITVYGEADSSGCGAAGAEVVLWTFAHEKFLYTTRAVGWPGKGGTVTFDATFSTAEPHGAAPVVAGFQGELFHRNGQGLPSGTRVEAYVGEKRCGVASTRSGDSFGGYVLGVVGPDSIPGCTRGATVTFRVDGVRVPETALNTPPGPQDALDLTVP